MFGGDALADPLTGLAAAAAWADAARRGGGRRLLVDLALADVAAWVAAGDGGVESEWDEVDEPPEPSPMAAPAAPAPALGADTERVLSSVRG